MQSSGSVFRGKYAIAFEWLLLLGVISGYFIWLSTNTVYSASEDARLLDVFDVDEYNHYLVIRDALENRSVCVDFLPYGHLYFNIVLWPLLFFQHFSPVSDKLIVFALRYAATISSVITVFLVYSMARRYWGKIVAWLSALFLMILPFSFNYYSVISHPDLTQLLFVVVSVFGCCEFIVSRKQKWLFVSSVGAGLAFSTKYGGVFILPVIWFLCLIPPGDLNRVIWRDFFSRTNLLAAVWRVLTTILLFIIVFALTSPCSLVQLQFIQGIAQEARHVSFGHVFKASNGPFEWFASISSTGLLGSVNGLFLAVALIVYIGEIWMAKGENIFSPKGLLWIWVTLFFLYAFCRVNYRTDRYLLLILPFLFILLVLFIIDALGYLKRWVFSKKIYVVVLVLLVILQGSELYKGFIRQSELINEKLTEEQDSAPIQAGVWLENNYRASTRILYDKYSYIPSKFQSVQGSFGIDKSLLTQFNPRVVVINESVRNKYLNPSDADLFFEGSERFMAIYDFYDLMEKQSLGYKLVGEFGSVKIYEKNR